MNYKKLLLTIVTVCCVVSKFDIAYAMDHAIVVLDQKPTFKSLAGIPLLSLEKVSNSRDRWSEERKRTMHEQLYESGEEKFLVLFNIATMLPPELQKIIVSDICNGKAEDIKTFFDKPMVDLVDTYDWSYQVFRGDIFPLVKKMAANSSNWTPATIFEHSKDIANFDSWRNNYQQCQGRKVLQSIDIVYEKILFQQTSSSADNLNITYAYRDSYTFSNFWKHQRGWQWILLPVVLYPFGVKVLAQYNYSELSLQEMEKITSQYQKQEILNATVRDKFQETQDDEWLDLLSTKIPNLDGYKQASIDGKKNITEWCYSLPAGLVGLVIGVGSGNSVEGCLNEKKWGFASRFCVYMGVALPIALTTIFGIVSSGFALDAIIERPFFGAACATGCYAAVVSLWNVIKMRSAREDWVSIGKLSQLLQRSDIEII